MLGQYELMRRHALGNFRDLLQDMSNDPAMLVWLDTAESKKGKPNENYARELMELFSLGIGNYTEKDIREAARAFTGWEIKTAKPVFNESQHDDGEKTVLGQTGNWKGDDIVRICLEQNSRPRISSVAQAVSLPGQRDDARRRRNCSPRWPSSSARATTTSGRWSRRCCARTCSSRRQVYRTHGQVAGRFRAGHRPRPGRPDRHAPPWRQRWKNWGRTCSTRRRSRAGTAARPGSTARRCCSARTWPWP